MMPIEPENYQIEATVAAAAEVKAAADSLFKYAQATDQLLCQHGSIYRSQAIFEPSSNAWRVYFEISSGGEKPLTASDFEIEIRRMLKGHL